MKRFSWVLLLFLVAGPAWSATTKQISVQQLKDMLTSLQDAKKTDEQVATEMKQVELTEELTTATMNGISGLIPGPLSTEQLYVLEVKSAVLPPPATDLPTAAAPDAAAQTALLAKAADYVAKTYSQLPALTASKMTARFQDHVEAVHTLSGMHNNITQDSDPVWQQTSLYIRLLNNHTDPAASQNGAEIIPKDKTQWGPNNMVASVGPPLTLGTILQEATANGGVKWLRWELINGKQTAVFGFNIDKKKTHFTLIYCCFPNTDTAGVVEFSKNGSSGQAAAGGSSSNGNLQTVSEWRPFKTSTGYHGEIFIDPDSGVVVRTVTEAALKPSDFVHSESVRTDYAPVAIGDKSLVVPVRSFTIAEVVPNGDSFAAKYAVRHSYVTQDYKDYQLTK